MWANDPKAKWLGPWSGLSHCERCHTLFDGHKCPRCGYETPAWEVIIVEGIERQVPKARQGALSLSTHMLIELLKREWQRPEPKFDYVPIFDEISPKVVIIILFWTLFEHLMDRFLDAALSRLPPKVHLDLLTRYSSIGSRVTAVSYTHLRAHETGRSLVCRL